jgi:hypothetical protein
MTDTTTRTAGFLALDKACDNPNSSNALTCEALRLAVSDDWDDTWVEELQNDWDLPVTREDVYEFFSERATELAELCSTEEGAKDVAFWAKHEAFDSDPDFFLDCAKDQLPLLYKAIMELED